MKISGKDEWVTLTATISDSWQLRWWILSQGGSIEVLSPSCLRKDIAEEVTASYRLYAS
jgi:predicted DNA-binding transcriptional regulator YafY